MIYELTNRDVWPSKRNFLDQNNVVFGYDDMQDCCESFGMGVYDPETHELVVESPAGLPYHFDFTRGAQDLHLNDHDRHKSFCFYHSEEYVEVLDVTQVYLLPDNGTDRELVLEAYTEHNGYYMHDFSLSKNDNPFSGNPAGEVKNKGDNRNDNTDPNVLADAAGQH